MVDSIVVAEGLHKRFGTTEALRSLDLRVTEGTVCGVLGPNGAGKTTAVRVLCTLLVPDQGSASIAGRDVVRDADGVRKLIGLAGQHAAVDEKLTGRENLVMFGRLYHLGERRAQARADELLERFDLTDAAGRLVRGYSGGMRRRLDLIASLITAPPVLFLDEPTTGLDPRSRNEIWSSVRELVAGGTTVVLTTQYLDEADRLADDIAVVDHGRVIASDSPERLKAVIGSRLDVVVSTVDDTPAAAAALARLTGNEPTVDGTTVSAAVHERAVSLLTAVREMDAAGVAAVDVALREPSLDEVFLALTGKPAEEEVAA
ncbi:ABC-2 type transport system ATP-binding protein [Herbihabitans rhizosphaerae]|uniref:ABC-2 type transport system ATP-binding protein n=1 Tax=Herbihabitans rhizosphaerae TaxID=1872711 RepID=A0A4V2EUF9_9PSEU|nr:ATP-binding cassette domain-containing protein [Herbihabitans rhizosphaerae]RZS44433.1 ABC-2 type transport system ATP-binding protein [Herbihabitans rhizosphaerae]